MFRSRCPSGERNGSAEVGHETLIRNTDHSQKIYPSSMAHLELISAGEPVCVWTDVSRTFTIRLYPKVLERLGTEARLAAGTAPRRGLEMGGLLLGHVESQDDTTIFWIEGCQPESDVTRLHGARAKKEAKGIGIYRSQRRSQRLALQAPDVELLERCFNTSDALFLLLDPVPGTAAFFIRADGNLKCVHKCALAPPLSPAAVPRQTRTSRKGTGLAALITTLVLVATVIGISYFRRPSAQPDQRAPQHLQLNVERAGPGLRLLWDRNSSALRGASNAVVHIRDGDRQSDRDITPSEFQAGSITYVPRSSEVTFRLEVYSVKPITGSVLAINLLSPSAITSSPSGQSKWRQPPKQ
jgi:hypothetical protein